MVRHKQTLPSGDDKSLPSPNSSQEQHLSTGTSQRRTIERSRSRKRKISPIGQIIDLDRTDTSFEDIVYVDRPGTSKDSFLTKDRERKQTALTNETEQEKFNRQLNDKQSKHIKRMNESEQERIDRLNKVREATHISRMNESDQEKSDRLNKVREATQISRMNESEQERTDRLNKVREATQISRMNESEQERTDRLNKVREATQISRINESEQEKIDRQSKDREATQISRMNESEQERIDRQRKDKQRKRTKLVNVNENMEYACSNYKNVEKHVLGDMTIECMHCKSLNFPEEMVSNRTYEFKYCCHYGKAIVNEVPEQNFPTRLKNLFTRKDPKSRKFFECIRSLNSSVSFASMNPLRYQYPSNRGPYCFRIHGQIYHKMNVALHPEPGDVPAFGQLFIVDTGEAMNVLQNINPNVDPEILNYVYNLIKDVNPYSQAYVMMKEEEDKEKEKALLEGRAPSSLNLLFGVNKSMDKNRYKIPRANEVAIIFVPGEDDEIPEARIVVREKGKELKILNSTDKNVTPMIYPLFFPRGTQGWHPAMKQTNGIKTLTRLQYASNCIAVRKEQFNPMLFGGKLFQQWCVDEYVKIEGDRMRWIIMNQKKIMADSYKNVDSFLLKKATNAGLKVGRKIILPATIVGSPRYIEKHFQDAMAIVRRFGKPDLFVTMTCNPKWDEVQSNLFAGQESSDRPDIVDRVFNLKVKALLEEVKTRLFGLCICWMYPVEFQLRGLPHIHLLLTLSKNDKLIDGNDVDKRGIKATIPDQQEDPELYELVKKHMIHGPCGYLNFNSPCMQEVEQNGKKIKVCSKGYPKAFQGETIVLENGFAAYARPNDGKYIEIRRNDGTLIKLDNRWVVPYMPYLLKRYRCHINVEKVNSVASVKYLHKYVHKGPDRTGIALSEKNVIDHDEVKEFVDARFVSPTDAIWRILEFPICDRSHSIKTLTVHLPGEQLYYFDDDMEEEELRDKINKNTELMAYFELNKTDDIAPKKFYHEIPEFYTFSKGNWTRRKKMVDFANENSKVATIGRLVKVLPSESERYYLRLLLLHVKGAKDFDNLRTVNEVCYPTYAEACLALGLIRDDEEWRKALEEASYYMMPAKLRIFFALILVHCGPSRPDELWTLFKDSLSEDFYRKHSKEISYELAYRELSKKIREAGKNLSDFPTLPQIDEPEYVVEVFNLAKELDIGLKMYTQMNDEQKHIVDVILNRIDNPNSNNSNFFFVSGAGGVGKTYVNKTLCHLVKGRGMKYSTMAFTGRAATLLPGGRTLHNRFGLSLDMETSKISSNSKAWNELKETDLFIVDESPMIDKRALNVIDQKLREITQVNELFGGKTMLWTGDFRQTLSIKKYATRTQIVNSTIKHSKYWKNAIKLKLTKNMRTLPTEKEFAKFLLDLGEGKLNDDNDDVVLPAHCISKTDLPEEIFGHLIDSEDWEKMLTSAILAPKNLDVSEMNTKVLAMMPGEERYYPSIDHAENEDKAISDEYLDEYLNSLNPSGFTQHDLYLKQNSIIMLLRNLNICEGLCNGSRLRVQDMRDNVLVCKLIEDECLECNSTHKESIVFIPRITLRCEDEYPFSLVRHQFPIRLGFAFSIIKAQGQTLDNCGIDLRKNVFGHGQLYTGVSRVKAWNSLKIRLKEDNLERKVKNIVYTEVLDCELDDE